MSMDIKTDCGKEARRAEKQRIKALKIKEKIEKFGYSD